MKVKELIDKLQELVQDRDITVDGYEIEDITICGDVNNTYFYVIESGEQC